MLENPLTLLPIAGLKLGDILHAFVDLVVILDSEGAILGYRINGAQDANIFSSRRHGQKIQDFFSAEDAESIARSLWDVQQSRNVSSFEFSLADRWFDAKLIPYHSSQFVLAAWDVTVRKNREDRTLQQLHQFSALRSVDMAIASGMDLKLLLALLLDQFTVLLRVDAASIALLNTATNELHFSSNKGFLTDASSQANLKIGAGYTGRVARERKMIHISDLTREKNESVQARHFAREKFITYFGVPLIAKGRVLGVLEIFHRSPFNADLDWMNFLTVIVNQTAIAIDSALMFRELQNANMELGLAYDATIDGWAHALDLRDHETEGHARRVTDLTIQLAMMLGVEKQDIVHIRRGAILHDIGKVAIPDQILFKPGPLSDDEWKVMRRHPAIAAELLTPIQYLSPALEIPRWHHERWDGTGYPDRLLGDEIPFAARLFALADVFDALTSNRPYRKAWSKVDAIHYVESHAGSHFDPNIVPKFLNLVRGDGVTMSFRN